MAFQNGYSANVALRLKVGERELSLSHVGPNKVSLRSEPAELPPSSAQLIIQVDERIDTMDVYLPHGVSNGSFDVEYI